MSRVEFSVFYPEKNFEHCINTFSWKINTAHALQPLVWNKYLCSTQAINFHTLSSSEYHFKTMNLLFQIFFMLIDGHNLNNIWYTDDIVLMAVSEDKLTKLLYKAAKKSYSWDFYWKFGLCNSYRLGKINAWKSIASFSSYGLNNNYTSIK